MTMKNKKFKGDVLWASIVGCMSVVGISGLMAAGMSMADKMRQLVSSPTESPEACYVQVSEPETMDEKPSGDMDEEPSDAMDDAPIYPTIDSTKMAFLDTTQVARQQQDERLSAVSQELAGARLCRYYNDRFYFTLLYPSCFQAGPLPMNNDGCCFRMGHGIVLKIAGSYNTSEETLRQRYVQDKGGLSQVTHSHKGKHHYVIAGFCDQETAKVETADDYSTAKAVGYWQKTALVKSPGEGIETWVTIRLYYPSSCSQEVYRLVQCLDLYNLTY